MPTQRDIAKHLDLSERRVRDVMYQLGVDWKKASMDEIREAYIRDLRDKAGGRGGDDHAALTKARTRDHEYAAELKFLQIKERAGELVPVDEVEPRLLAMVTAARTELLTLPASLSQEMRALHGVEVDPAIIEDRINDALTHLATSLRPGDAGDDGEGSAGVGAAAEDQHDGVG